MIALFVNAGFPWVGEMAMLMPIGPSWGCPDGLNSREFWIAFVTWIKDLEFVILVICLSAHPSTKVTLQDATRNLWGYYFKEIWVQ